jgi:hypothetical protein
MGCVGSCTPLVAPSLTGTSSLRCWVAGLEGNGVPGRFELWSSGFGAAGCEVDVDSKSMGDAVFSSSGSGAADLEENGNGVPGRFELCSPAADLKEVNVDSKSMGDAMLSPSGFRADDLEGNENGVSGRLGPCSPAVDLKELNAVLKSMGDDALSSSDSPAGRSGDGSGVTRSNTRTSGSLGTNLTPFFGRAGGGGGAVVCDGRCWDSWAFRRCLGLMSPVRLLTKLEPCLIGDGRD